ncbi:MAG: hypothetical protein ABGY95_06535 [Rubritalea sp.]|uniref:hypothetical protein n=1 Tax=Rubritalea sp. TaxID=2109375 RepID=UPI003241F52B
MSRWWNKLAARGVLEKVHISIKIKTLPAIIALVIVGLSHVLLDGIIHSDIEPLRAFGYDYPFYRLINISHLHYILTFCGFVGIALMFIRFRWK